MPWAKGADGVEGPGSEPPQRVLHSLCADRRLERKESELPRAFASKNLLILTHSIVLLRFSGVSNIDQPRSQY